jgi:hypothetical protein
MSRPTEQGFSDLLLKYFTTLEPVAKDVTLKSEMKKVAQPDGSTKVEMVPTKGDAYLPKEMATAMAKSIAKAVFEQIFKFTEEPLIVKVNELIDQYNQLRADFITGGGSTSASQVSKIP